MPMFGNRICYASRAGQEQQETRESQRRSDLQFILVLASALHLSMSLLDSTHFSCLSQFQYFRAHSERLKINRVSSKQNDLVEARR